MPIDATMNVTQAANLYAKSAKSAGMQSVAAPSNGPNFGDILRDASESAINTMHQGERMSARAIIGDADLTDVVQAVTNAEVTLQTITAVRDKMIGAYQEILRMPM
jgi:flagellar hook-basal body complex protein FliE